MANDRVLDHGAELVGTQRTLLFAIHFTTTTSLLSEKLSNCELLSHELSTGAFDEVFDFVSMSLLVFAPAPLLHRQFEFDVLRKAVQKSFLHSRE